MAFIPDYRIATFVAGVATLLMGAIIVGMAPKAKLHRAAGLFFLLRGGWLTLVAFSSPANDLQGRLVVYCLIGIPFAAIWLAHRLRQEYGPKRRGLLPKPWPAILFAIAAAIEIAYLLDHELFFGGTLGGPLVLFDPLQFVAYAAVAVAAYAGYRYAEDGPSKRALYAFMMGFIAEPLFFSTQYLTAHGLVGWRFLKPSMAIITSVVIATVAGILVSWQISLRGRREPQFDWSRTASVAAFAILTGALVSLNARFEFAHTRALDLPQMNAFWTLWTVLATVYAILRYRLFAIDLRVKLFLRVSTTAGLVGTFFLIISEAIESWIQVEGTLESVVVATLVSAALHPANRAAKRLADLWMPGVRKTAAYRKHRREEIYRAAFERAWVDGAIDPHEQEVLEQMAKGLGLTRSQTQEIESSAASSTSPSA